MLIKRNHPGAEQFNVGAAVHGPLDCFQSIDLALGLPTAPRSQHRVSDSVEVLPRSSREALHGVDAFEELSRIAIFKRTSTSQPGTANHDARRMR